MLSSPTRQVSTTELVDGCRNGDAASWSTLVHRFEPVVYTVARRSGLDADDAADVTQATFAALLRQINELRETGRLASWLATVAHRHATRAKQRAGTLQRVSLVEAETIVARADTEIFDEWDHWDAISQALSGMGQPCRELITLLFLDPSQPSQQAIADRLGKPLGSIGPMRGRCLDKLRLLLDQGDLS